MEVRVVHTLPTCQRPETDYVRVHTCTAPFDDTVTLATIERVVEKANPKPDEDDTLVKTLILRQPMTAASVGRRAQRCRNGAYSLDSRCSSS